MDQHPRYLTWMKNKYIASLHFQTPMMNKFNNSWEEQAFADDVAFIWPPRSYSCSFCKRKFRSAQALGGHMNVHRRDRARLKLSQSEALSPHQNYNFTPIPNPNYNPTFLALSNSPRIVSGPKVGFEKNVRSREDMGEVEDEVNLSIGLNLVCDHNVGIYPKRHKPNVLSMPIFIDPCSKGLDLELRLGDSPKMK